ncbi:MAG: D-alanyl-D-alanine carboxypeptidase/D-alanyl-D-alanine endopeptidase [Ignavibacteriaceae bacterium]|jgi:D-alanyl-D-alanine carboxypeptidase/D-alanyl-D-alanine-endopeptidase (penicillin-binding protein 4)
MGVKYSFFALLILILAFPVFAQEAINDTTPKYSYSTLQEFWSQMNDIFNDPNFSNAQWGVVIQSLETGEYFYKRNEDKLFLPASNLKLFTTAAGLTLLGSEYKYKTNVYMNGKIDGSVLKGDLVIQGRGDPTISGRFYDGNIYKVFDDWADSLSKLGVDEITGNIIGDDNSFDEVGLGAGWSWDYESEWFAAPSSAISFNDNVVNVYVTVNKENHLPQVSIEPVTKYIIILNKVSTVPADSITSINVYRDMGTNVVTVYGTIKQNSDTVKTFVTVNNPTQYAMVVLKDVLKRKGITIDGYPIDVDDISLPLDYSKMTKLFTQYSPPLKEIIKVINKNSENFFAEQLLKTIGLETKNFGSSENGISSENKLFREMGINPEGMNIVDGSGLSRLDLVTPRQIVTLLSYMYKSKYFIPFYNSLPIAGVDGTLGNRMQNSKAQGNIRAKTGFLEGVRSLSGYAYTGDHEPVAFSIIVNNFDVPVKLAENIQDLVCLRLANFRRK